MGNTDCMVLIAPKKFVSNWVFISSVDDSSRGPANATTMRYDFRLNNSNQSIRERWALGDYRSIGRVISPVSAKLVRLVNVKPIDSVLDVACGFGNTAITARRVGAKVTGIDITPELLAQAKEEESIAQVSGIDWREVTLKAFPLRIII